MTTEQHRLILRALFNHQQLATMCLCGWTIDTPHQHVFGAGYRDHVLEVLEREWPATE